MMHPDQSVSRDSIAYRVNTHEKIIPHHENNCQEFREHYTENHAEPEYLPASLQLACTEILARKCHCRLRERICYIICEVFEIQRQ